MTAPNKVISFCLFGKNPRYFYNIPFMLLACKILFPDWTPRFYCSSDCVNSPNFNKIPNPIIINAPYIGTYPTMWRMLPFFDTTVDMLMCRDVDWIFTTHEIKAVEYFLKSNHSIQSVRGPNVAGRPPIMAGGICFKLNEVRKFVQCKMFAEYVQMHKGDWKYGCDEQVLRELLKPHYDIILDCPLPHAERSIHGYNPIYCPPIDFLQTDLRSEVVEFLKICDRQEKTNRYPNIYIKDLSIFKWCVKRELL